MKVALAHDWLVGMRGGESVLEMLAEIYPDAPIYTTVCDRAALSPALASRTIITTDLQKKRGAVRHHTRLFPYMPAAWEQFDFREYDMVLSSSTSCAKALITAPRTMHICYCNTPMRYGWEFYHDYLTGMGRVKRKALPYLMNYIRVWDAASADRVDYFIANSRNVANRIYKHYRRDAAIIHPAVRDLCFAADTTDEGFYLVVSALTPYKRVDLAVEACNALGLPLVVIGTGEEEKRLRKLAGPTVRLLGRQSDEVVLDHYRRCHALLFAGEEDFGITPLEAMASGKPVLAYGRGGVLETVVEGQTGHFFGEQTALSLQNGITEMAQMHFDPAAIRAQAARFGREDFCRAVRTFCEERYEEYCRAQETRGELLF